MPVGRPTVMTPGVVSKLEEAFLMGCTDREACVYAAISHTSLYKYCQENQGFTDRKETLKTNPVLKAKMIQSSDLEEGNSAIAQKVIERKEGSKVTLAGELGVTVVIKGKDAIV